VRIRVLGSAAGGGFPQWNCGCENCRGVRAGTVAASPRTQESIAVSADGARWAILNCGPDVARQLDAFPALHPRGLRDTPVRAVVLTNGDLDHCLGLLCLRESQPLTVHATARVRRGFVEENAFARTLARWRGQVTWQDLVAGEEQPLGGDPALGLSIVAVPAPGKPPVHFEQWPADPADNVGVVVREDATGRRLAYFPGVARVDATVARAVDGVDALFFDGTFWSDDELPALGIAARRATQMGHLPVGGEDGSLAALSRLRAGRRVYIHVNNTNPLLREDSAERATVRARGWDVATDGMEVDL